MEAMIFAAGRGRRLRPLTDSTPKALVDFGGAPLLERVGRRLVAAGAHRLIVNAHYLAEQVATWARQVRLGVPVVVSREDEVAPAPLDTNGGLSYAARLFEAQAPFLLHNCDVVTAVDLAAVYRAHLEGAKEDGRLATLVVARRNTTRPLLLDSTGVVGRANRAEGWEVIARDPQPGGEVQEYGFCGIHVLSERVFDRTGSTDAPRAPAGTARTTTETPAAARRPPRQRPRATTDAPRATTETLEATGCPPRQRSRATTDAPRATAVAGGTEPVAPPNGRQGTPNGTGVHSIMDSYMSWLGDGERIGFFDATGTPWHDIGTPSRLAEARRAFIPREGSR